MTASPAPSFSDSDQGKSDAKYMFERAEGEDGSSTVHDGSPYAQQLAAVMATNFTKLGGKVLSQEAVAPTDVDMHPVLTRIASEEAGRDLLPRSSSPPRRRSCARRRKRRAWSRPR